MEPQQAGVTALITAYARAYHATHDFPKIFDDSIADQLYSPEERERFDESLIGMISMVDPVMAATHPQPAEALARVMQMQLCPITLSRSCYMEECLNEAVQEGVRQYVILGAGFDTFAFRRPDLMEQLNVYEIDHPATQAMKRERIAAAGWNLPARLQFVATDFSKETLSTALKRSAYDPHRLSIYSWLGVSYYLDRDVVDDTLRSIALLSPSGSQMIFDYLDSEAFDPLTAGHRVQLMRNIAQMAGEPMKSSFDPQQLDQTLRAVGFRLIENLNPADIEARYFHNRTDDYHAFEHIYFARAEVL